MFECVLLIGLPGSGKSTFYRQRLSATHVHISKDLLPRSSPKASRQEALLREALRQQRSVALDNTHVTAAERAPVIALAHDCGARVVGVYIEASTREAVARNEARQGRERVPKVAIFTMAKRLEPPRPTEGFDDLHTYRVGPDGAFEAVGSSPAEADGR